MNKKEYEQVALSKIKSLFGVSAGEDSVTLFVDHHLSELEPGYFLKTYGTETPNSSQILDSLVLVDSWSSEDDGNDNVFDFSLPGDVTDYLLSVRFSGESVEEVSMES